MNQYIHTAGKLKALKEVPFKLEKEIQSLFEQNLETILGCQLVKSEFKIKNRRIDTLAYDKQSKAFIIIEYKRDRNMSVIDQGFTYLGLMLENKADFIIEYNESLKGSLKRDVVEWSQSRVVFVAPSFTDNQIQAANFKDLPIDLWEIKRFESNIISINELKKTNNAESVKQITKNKSELSSITNEIVVYTEEDHLSGASDEIKELYSSFREAILALSNDMDIKPQKSYIAFKTKTNVTDIVIQKKGLKLFINAKKGTLNDPLHLMQDMSSVGASGNGDYALSLSDTTQLEYIMSLVKQVV